MLDLARAAAGDRYYLRHYASCTCRNASKTILVGLF